LMRTDFKTDTFSTKLSALNFPCGAASTSKDCRYEYLSSKPLEVFLADDAGAGKPL
jgi:hypothetical protein